MSHTPLISRAQAGLVAPRSVTRRDLGEDTGHYGGPSPWPASADRSSPARFAATTDHATCATKWRAYQRFHMLTRGWQDIAYSSAVCPHGYRFEGRGHHVRTAAQGTTVGNDRSHATCYIAGDGDPLTEPAKAAFNDEHVRLEGLDKGHRDWKPTKCPGDPLYVWIKAGRPGGAPPVGTPPRAVLRLADPYMRGDEVRGWQLILAGAGLLPASGVDGVFGPNTDRATRAFQAKLGVTVDGIVGPSTRLATGNLLAWLAALERQKAVAPPYPGPARLRTPRQTGPVVTAWQRQLHTRGYRLAVDGVFGLATNHAVWHFQSTHHLTPDAIAGPATWRALTGG